MRVHEVCSTIELLKAANLGILQVHVLIKKVLTKGDCSCLIDCRDSGANCFNTQLHCHYETEMFSWFLSHMSHMALVVAAKEKGSN